MSQRRAYLTFAIGVVAIAAILIGGKALLGIAIDSYGFGSLPPALVSLIANLLLFGAIVAFATIMLVRDGRLSGVAGPSPGRESGLGLALGLSGIGVTAAMTVVAGTLTPGTGAIDHSWLLLGFLAIVIQAGGEEIAFRGWLQPLLARAAGPLPALLLPTLAFAALHLIGGARAPLALVNLFLGGLWFALLAWRSGGIALPAAAHIAWNAAEQLLLGLDPNPGVGGYGALADFDLVGSPWWGGSEQGLNASVGTTAVLLALIVPLAVGREPLAKALNSPALRG